LYVKQMGLRLWVRMWEGSPSVGVECTFHVSSRASPRDQFGCGCGCLRRERPRGERVERGTETSGVWRICEELVECGKEAWRRMTGVAEWIVDSG
jgi:hypothetical protein